MNTNRFRVLFLVVFGFTIFFTDIQAQRVFVPSEEGILIELKEGGKNGKVALLATKPDYPNKMQTAVTLPFKIYIYSDMEVEEDEFFIDQIKQIGKSEGFMRVGAQKSQQNKKMKNSIRKIASNIYEINYPELEISNEDDINKAKNTGRILANLQKFVIGYEPNKKHKKEGKTDKLWYANISQNQYDVDDIGEWSTEQAIESVNQLMAEGKTTEQLFASIKPQQAIPQVVNGQQIQYVVVQNQPSIVPQENNQGIQNEEIKEIISDVDKNIPYRDISNENTFALIIANEDYNKVAPVNFALRDGKKINEYLKKTLGIEKDHIAYLENATLNDMRYEVNRLSKISDAYNGEASFIIYYIGHGIPDEKNGNGYLLPVDGYGNDVTTAYPLAELYSQLSNLEAKKIVLFTDACFSGANKSGEMLVAARGIAIRSNPNEARGHLIAFSACQGDETAYSYDEKGHGLLTYYFLKKLKETGGQTTLGELEEYIVDNVGKTAIVINGKTQTPSVSVSPKLQDIWRSQTFYE